MRDSRVWLLVASVVLWLSAGALSAATIGPPENGDLSAGDTSDWVIEQSSGASPLDSYAYEDVGGDHGGALRRQAADGAYESHAFNSNAADVGSNGSIEFKLVTMPAGGGDSIGIGFLGDPTYNGGTIACPNNNQYDRGYYIQIQYTWGSFYISLGRKSGGWSNAVLQSTAANTPFTLSDINDGQWHTVSITDDGTGVITASLDGTEVINYDDSANYLPNSYAANYASGGLWGVWSGGAVDFYVDNLQVGAVPVPEPATLGMLALGAAAFLGVRRRRA